MSSTQIKVALHKEKHPERYCPVPKCLWRVKGFVRDTNTFEPFLNCPGGYCPRHQNLRKGESQ